MAEEPRIRNIICVEGEVENLLEVLRERKIDISGAVRTDVTSLVLAFYPLEKVEKERLEQGKKAQTIASLLIARQIPNVKISPKIACYIEANGQKLIVTASPNIVDPESRRVIDITLHVPKPPKKMVERLKLKNTLWALMTSALERKPYKPTVLWAEMEDENLKLEGAEDIEPLPESEVARKLIEYAKQRKALEAMFGGT